MSDTFAWYSGEFYPRCEVAECLLPLGHYDAHLDSPPPNFMHPRNRHSFTGPSWAICCDQCRCPQYHAVHMINSWPAGMWTDIAGRVIAPTTTITSATHFVDAAGNLLYTTVTNSTSKGNETRMIRIDSRYTCDGDYIRGSSGRIVPADEPLFLFRARDQFALRTLSRYRLLCLEGGAKQMHTDALSGVIERFNNFALQHPERMRIPGQNIAPAHEGINLPNPGASVPVCAQPFVAEVEREPVKNYGEAAGQETQGHVDPSAGRQPANMSDRDLADIEFTRELVLEVIHARSCYPGDDAILAALVEEAGEVAKALMYEPWQNVKKECIQLACVAQRLATEGDQTMREFRRNNVDGVHADAEPGGPFSDEMPGGQPTTENPAADDHKSSEPYKSGKEWALKLPLRVLVEGKAAGHTVAGLASREADRLYTCETPRIQFYMGAVGVFMLIRGGGVL